MYPYTQLHLGKTRSVAVAGPHLSVLGSEYVLVFGYSLRGLSYTELGFRTGRLEGSTTNFDEQNAADLLKSGPIRFSAVDAEFEHFVTVGEDKKLKVWELDGPKLRSQRFAIASPFA
jgi:tRNA (guanine-N(7)-)-methyltransferase subunit TRM82